MNTNNLINVNIDTRQVVIPNNFMLGVENDNSCSKIGFLVPKKSDITDISDLTFKINTLSARGTADIIECEVAEQDDYFIITADLKGTIFECNGKAIINLCGCKYDDNNNIIKKWGTEDIVVSVGAHTDAEKAIEQLYPSVLEELKKKIDASKVTEEQLNTIAQKVAEKGFYTKSEVDSLINAKPTITVDTVVSATSDNPVSSKAVSTSLNALSNEIGEGIEAQLAEKADKADLDKKVNKSDVVTNVDVEGIETNTNPIATSVVYNALTSFYSEFEAKHVEMHSKFNLVGLDTNTLYVITKALNDELNFSEFWFVFYGRENDKDDTLTNGDGSDGIYINDTRVLARPLVYIRKSGTYFYTVGHFKTVGEFVFGTVSRCDGNGTTSTYTVEPIQATKVDSITIVTNNLFKGDSKFAVYAR